MCSITKIPVCLYGSFLASHTSHILHSHTLTTAANTAEDIRKNSTEATHNCEIFWVFILSVILSWHVCFYWHKAAFCKKGEMLVTMSDYESSRLMDAKKYKNNIISYNIYIQFNLQTHCFMQYKKLSPESKSNGNIWQIQPREDEGPVRWRSNSPVSYTLY